MDNTFRYAGCSFTCDPNIGLIGDTINPLITVKFQNEAGEVRTRTYQAHIEMVGVKIEAAFRFDAIFFTNSYHFTYENSDKEIVIGKGIEIMLPLLGLAIVDYADFVNMPGGIVIASLSLGIAISPISYITGGVLRPIR